MVENGVSVTAPVSDVAIAYTGSESNLSLDMEDLLATGVGEKYIVVETADAYYRFALIIATQVISDLEDLQAFDALIAAATGDNAVTGYYVLGADIVVPEDSDFVMGNYTIGFSYWADLSGNIFNGIFDGMGYTISGLKVGDGGMFGNVIDGTIRNVSLVDIYAYGKGENSAVTINNGGSNILAQMMSGTVENVFVSGSAASQDGWYSGLVYDADGATFTNCVFDVELRGSLESWDAPMGLLRTNTYSNVVFLNDSGRVYTNHTGNAYSTSSPDATNFRVYADVAAAVAGEEFGFGSFTKDGSGNILFNGEIVVAAEAAA